MPTNTFFFNHISTYDPCPFDHFPWFPPAAPHGFELCPVQEDMSLRQSNRVINLPLLSRDLLEPLPFFNFLISYHVKTLISYYQLFFLTVNVGNIFLCSLSQREKNPKVREENKRTSSGFWENYDGFEQEVGFIIPQVIIFMFFCSVFWRCTGIN